MPQAIQCMLLLLVIATVLNLILVSFIMIRSQSKCSSHFKPLSSIQQNVIPTPCKFHQCTEVAGIKTAVLPQRGDYWVDANRILAGQQFHGNDSITLSTPADFTHLDNLVPLAERWNGPVSCCLYATGTDYVPTLRAIQYLRECASPVVKMFVTFHIIYHKEHVPKGFRSNTWEILQESKPNCSQEPKFGPTVRTYRSSNNLTFPINTARNIARMMAKTHFVFPCDIELYPSEGVIKSFLKMIENKSDESIHSSRLKVFALPVFELSSKVKVLPRNKLELKLMLEKKLAIPFHSYTCGNCHTIPRYKDWLRSTGAPDVFTVAKREHPNLTVWEPIYIGTKFEPEFDERLTWESQMDKRLQVYTMCLLDYEFHVLSNAFLVHKPGIKKGGEKPTSLINRTVGKVLYNYAPEINALYGRKRACYV